mgnify:FL=1
MRPRVLIFDVGGVFVKHREGTLPQFFLDRHTAPGDQVLNFYFGKHHDYERNRISSEEFFKQACNEAGYRGTYEEFEEDFCKAFEFEFDREMFDFFLKLKVRCVGEVEFWILSNVNEIHYRYWRRHWPGLFDNFWQVFLSFELGERKPDPEIFKLVLGAGQKTPYQCVFVDDREENGVYPKQIGMGFIHYRGVAKLHEALKQLGFEID